MYLNFNEHLFLDHSICILSTGCRKLSTKWFNLNIRLFYFSNSVTFQKKNIQKIGLYIQNKTKQKEKNNLFNENIEKYTFIYINMKSHMKMIL